MRKYYLRIECVDKEFEVSEEDYRKAYISYMSQPNLLPQPFMLPTSFKTGVLYGRIEKVSDEEKVDCTPAKYIPLKYRVSFLTVLVDEYAGENIADEISNALQRNKVCKEDVINIESSSAQLGISLPLFRIIVWYKK